MLAIPTVEGGPLWCSHFHHWFKFHILKAHLLCWREVKLRDPIWWVEYGGVNPEPIHILHVDRISIVKGLVPIEKSLLIDASNVEGWPVYGPSLVGFVAEEMAFTDLEIGETQDVNGSSSDRTAKGKFGLSYFYCTISSNAEIRACYLTALFVIALTLLEITTLYV